MNQHFTTSEVQLQKNTNPLMKNCHKTFLFAAALNVLMGKSFLMMI